MIATQLDYLLPTEWMIGYLASLVRVGGIVAGAPILARRIPAVGRTVMVIGVGLLLAGPIEIDGPAELLSVVAANTVIGLLLGFLVTVTWLAFLAAGSLIDLSAGLSIGATFDPLTGASVSVFDRTFDQVAILLFFLIGGDRLLVAGVAASTRAVPLDGAIDLSPGLMEVAIERTGFVVVGAVQIAAPVLTALFLAELVLGVGARMLPQFNVFLLGIPAKILLALAGSMVLILGFSDQVGFLLEDAEDLLPGLLTGIGG